MCGVNDIDLGPIDWINRSCEYLSRENVQESEFSSKISHVNSILTFFFPQEKLNEALEGVERDFSRGVTLERCQSLVVGGIYLAIQETMAADDTYRPTFTAYRVKVSKMDNIQKKALCFYIDDGYQEYLSFDHLEPNNVTKLYHIPLELSHYAAQAIHFSLFNLEDFAENPYAIKEVIHSLSDKSFLAKVKSTKQQYDTQIEAELEPKVNAIFYDVSVSEFVLINKLIIERICDRLQPPKL